MRRPEGSSYLFEIGSYDTTTMNTEDKWARQAKINALLVASVRILHQYDKENDKIVKSLKHRIEQLECKETQRAARELRASYKDKLRPRWNKKTV